MMNKRTQQADDPQGPSWPWWDQPAPTGAAWMFYADDDGEEEELGPIENGEDLDDEEEDDEDLFDDEEDDEDFLDDEDEDEELFDDDDDEDEDVFGDDDDEEL